MQTNDSERTTREICERWPLLDGDELRHAIQTRAALVEAIAARYHLTESEALDEVARFEHEQEGLLARLHNALPG